MCNCLQKHFEHKPPHQYCPKTTKPPVEVLNILPVSLGFSVEIYTDAFAEALILFPMFLARMNTV